MPNYLSAINSNFLIYGLVVACFTGDRLKLYQRVVQLHAHFNGKLNKIIDIPLVVRTVEQSEFMDMGRVYKGLYLFHYSVVFCFFSLSHVC